LRVSKLEIAYKKEKDENEKKRIQLERCMLQDKQQHIENVANELHRNFINRIYLNVVLANIGYNFIY
jgi:hypothetical protein